MTVPADDSDLQPGLREELVTRALAERLAALDGRAISRPLGAVELSPLLERHSRGAIREALGNLGGQGVEARAELVNRLVAWLLTEDRTRHELVTPPQLLTGILPEDRGLGSNALPERPQVPLTANELLVNDRKQPSLGSQLLSELQSAEEVDLICAFVIWSGVFPFLDELRRLVERGGRLRVITTTYMGATEARAIDALHDVGADIRVAFDAQRTKLHAKAWVLRRPHGLTTAFIGSSNLSLTAMHHGLEWNVRLAQAEAASVIERMRGTFDTYWEDDAFETYEPARDRTRLDEALGRQKRRKSGLSPIEGFAGLDVHPHPHQRRMLEDLMVQRDRHDRHRNLVVAATGTGKTVVAALDYQALCQRAGRRLSLLFVAHRERILQQSRAMFAAVLKEPSFGELFGAGQRPRQARHVFAMVQSLRGAAVDQLRPDEFDVVIVDEFHHAEAPSYTRLLQHLKPNELLGLTATPERMDGRNVARWFDDRIAVELRIWEAIDRGYLAPFQYFGVADTEDFSQLQWRRSGYDVDQLNSLLTGNHARVKRTLDAIQRTHPAPGSMRALGFCVSVAHATFMAEAFNRGGVPSRAISGDTPEAERVSVLRELRQGALRCVFSVDVLGEGVDVPNVDTVLLLRPTQSATVFAQQIGRGLRLSEDKAALTIIDLVGQQHRQFRFEDRLRAIVDERQGSIREQAEEHFPYLPSGCSIVLDRQARDIVLDNLRKAARLTQWATLVDELRELGDVTLDVWHARTERRIADLYRLSDRSWTRLRREAGFPTPPPAPGEESLLKAIRRLDHIDDPMRTGFYLDLLGRSQAPVSTELTHRERRMATMLCVGIGAAQSGDTLDEALARLWPHAAVREELRQLFVALSSTSHLLEEPLTVAPAAPLALHASYSRQEALLALGDGTVGKPPTSREGVRWLPDAGVDAFFVTLRKSEKLFSPSTMYRDYALSRELFHWESQNATHEGTETGQRYIHHSSRGSEVLLFVREMETRANGAGAPFTCLGPADYVRHEGNRPMQITWRLRSPLPEVLLEASQLVAAA